MRWLWNSRKPVRAASSVPTVSFPTPVLPELWPGISKLKDYASWIGAHSQRTGYAVHLPSAGVRALIDAPPLSAEECNQFQQLGLPAHILLTCSWHLRGSNAYRHRWGCPIWIHEAGLAAAETTIDGTFRTGDRLWDTVEVL